MHGLFFVRRVAWCRAPVLRRARIGAGRCSGVMPKEIAAYCEFEVIQMKFAWIEHFVILPFRWFKIHVRNWVTLQQRCKVCGNRDKFDFHVSNEVWKAVVPEKYQNRVVCLACFDDFVEKKRIDKAIQLELICFAGRRIRFVHYFRD